MSFAVSLSFAQSVPALISYQGRIADANGKPLATADYTLTATLWSAPSGGSNLWTEVHTDTPVVQGFFNLILGGLSNGLANALSATNVHIEVTSSTPAATSTRQRLLSVPYAMRAADSERVQGVDVARLTGLKPAADVNGMVLIPTGTFEMGDRFSEAGADELPVHPVTVSAFWMDKTEVTKAKWDEVKYWSLPAGYAFNNAGTGKATNHPVHSVSWYDCVKWCNARSQKEGRRPCYYTDTLLTVVYTNGQVDLTNDMVDWSADGYRLPTEAEWEYAARGGVSSRRFSWGPGINHSYSNYRADATAFWWDTSRFTSPTYHPTGGETDPRTAVAGRFDPNGYGLYDTTGNLWEYCWDKYSDTYYSSSPVNSPKGPSSGVNRVMRGGSWADNAYFCRIACRDKNTPSGVDDGLGFRAVRASQ